MSNTEVIVPSELVADLCLAFEKLVAARSAVQKAITDDEGQYDLFIPKYGETDKEHSSPEARQAAIRSINQLYKQSDPSSAIEAGLLCASPESIATIEVLNSAKDVFKACVLEIRKLPESTKLPSQRITRYISTELKTDGYRTPELIQAMQTIGINELDLKKCYAKIRIMPPNLDVFCWTWATSHNRINKITVKDAKEKMEDMFEGNADAIDINTKLLAQCASNEMLVQKVELKNQLRANYAYVVDGQTKRTACTISGVVIVQGPTLPRFIWRDDPDTTGNKSLQVKRESGIEATPIIEQMRLYRYVR